MNEKTATKVGHSETKEAASRVGLDLAQELLHRQRQILTLMLVERVRRVERARPEQRGAINALWTRAIARQANMVRRLAEEVDRIGDALGVSVGKRRGRFAA